MYQADPLSQPKFTLPAIVSLSDPLKVKGTGEEKRYVRKDSSLNKFKAKVSAISIKTNFR